MSQERGHQRARDARGHQRRDDGDRLRHLEDHQVEVIGACAVAATTAPIATSA
jgi:hypothetical protein